MNIFLKGADPGFFVGWDFNPPGDRQRTILPNVKKKLHEIEKILGRVGGGGVRGGGVGHVRGTP